jgi:hypothetical protein
LIFIFLLLTSSAASRQAFKPTNMSPNKATAKSEEKANFPDPPQGTSEGESILLSWRKLVDDFKSTAGSAKKPEGTTLLPHFFKRRVR